MTPSLLQTVSLTRIGTHYAILNTTAADGDRPSIKELVRTTDNGFHS